MIIIIIFLSGNNILVCGTNYNILVCGTNYNNYDIDKTELGLFLSLIIKRKKLNEWGIWE